MFEAAMQGIREETVKRLYTVMVRREQKIERKQVANANTANVGGDSSVKKAPIRKVQKPGRNDPCPCGSGKKYKKCCGLNE